MGRLKWSYFYLIVISGIFRRRLLAGALALESAASSRNYLSMLWKDAGTRSVTLHADVVDL